MGIGGSGHLLVGLVLGLVLAAGCARPDDGLGLIGDGPDSIFPSSLHLDEDGFVDLARASWPEGERPLTLPLDRSAWRTGFSPAQLFVVRIDGVDGDALPGWSDPPADSSSVFMVDLETGERLPAMAELDAHPAAVDAPSLLIRPLQGLIPGHEVAVVVTTRAVARPPRFDDLVRGKGPRDLSRETRDLLDLLEGSGVDPDAVALAWSVPIEDGLKPTRTAVAARSDADIAWSFDEVREGEEADEGAYRSVAGTLTVTGVLDEEGRMNMDLASGEVRPTGTWQTPVHVHLPAGIEDAEPGSVPIVVYGHGIFQSPDRYFDGRARPDVVEIASRGQVIFIGIPWRGLSRADLALASEVAGDIGELPRLTGALAQSQVAARQLVEALKSGEMLDDPIFQGATGQSLPQRDRVGYFGISLGGIQGGVLVGLGAPVDFAVLHVGGSMWSTMLERSSNWTLLEAPLVRRVPDPWDRQRLYAWTQLHWDQAEPMAAAVTWPRDASPVLVQEALHDEQVPNLTTRAFARTLGLSVVGPVVDPPWGMGVGVAPTQPGASGYVQHDPETDPPPELNRPSPVTEAHYGPRSFPGVRGQILRYLSDGVITHPCGAQPCTASNPGE